MNPTTSTNETQNASYERHWMAILAIIVAFFLFLGVSYMLATPPLEASDEYKHYPVVQFIQNEGELVVLDPDDPGRWLQEGAQPPLYYAIMAELTAGIDTSDLPQVHERNPHTFVGDPNQLRNKNLILHQPENEQFPGVGTIRAIYVIRLASLLLGAGSIVVTAYLGRMLFSARAGLFAAALTAFNPMFLFVHAAVNNDSLAIFLGTLGIFLLVRLWRQLDDGTSVGIEHRAWVQYLALGVVLGLGLLTKLSLGGLLGLTGLALALMAWRKRNWQTLFIGGGLILVVALLISGWWFGRNLIEYGDLTGLAPFVAVQGVRDMPLQLSGWIAEFGTLYRTYWGLFGGVNIAMPQVFYLIANVTLIAGLAGLLLFKRIFKQFPSGTWLLLAWAGIVFALLVRWTVIYPSFQGRLLFPALGSINVLWAAGWLVWDKLLSERIGHKPWIELWISGYFLVIAVIIPWITIRPAYAYPEPVTELPVSAEFGPVAFTAPDGIIQLVGVELAQNQAITPGKDEFVNVTLYWQAVDPVENNYVSTVHLLGRDFQSVGNVSRYPGWGMIPTSQWQAGEIWRDDYYVRANADAVGPSILRLDVGLYDAESDSDLPATSLNEDILEFVLVGDARLDSAENPPQPDTTLDIAFAENITLNGYSMFNAIDSGETLPITLYWQADATPARDYTVFVQLLSADGELVGSGDAPPVNNFYPTLLWQAGDVIDDLHFVPISAELPPGTYTIAVGLYEPETFARVPRLDSGDSVSWTVEIE